MANHPLKCFSGMQKWKLDAKLLLYPYSTLVIGMHFVTEWRIDMRQLVRRSETWERPLAVQVQPRRERVIALYKYPLLLFLFYFLNLHFLLISSFFFHEALTQVNHADDIQAKAFERHIPINFQPTNMMIDPAQAIEAFKGHTSSLLVPTSTARPTPTPLPTVRPGPPIYHEKVGETGTRTLWVIFALMLLSTLALTGMAWRVPVQKRVFHVLTTFITVVGTISYFAMATGDGNSFSKIILHESHKHVPDTIEFVYRQIFWARYIDWAITTPLILLNLALLAGMDGASIVVTIAANILMNLLGLFAAFGVTRSQKCGYFTFAIVAYLVVVYQLVISGRRAVSSKDSKTGKLFASLGGYVLILWILYPIVWAIGDGARKWSVDTEIVAYAVLDILVKPVFGFWLLWANAAGETLSFDGWWSRGADGEGSIRIADDGA
ncbi:putative opsin-1 [Venustampulla echinocandica]|uniref:Putative opsin-1 n=1 Tax=Venustampulla echinocandica TaxID=2656787 RepID=A0A370TLN9_9HELO|nr:putative opsin-1 [Venustampulla echinocandica]RDL36446.1 putative opsin-1 [Venustampulla echinocandica]